MPHFPATITAYNLTTEYCTIQRAIQYQQAHQAISKGQKPLFDSRGYENLIYRIYHAMSDEIKTVVTGHSQHKKDKLWELLVQISEDERVSHFKVTAIFIVEDFNKIVTGSQIPTGDAFSDFLKDGYVLSSLLLSNVNHALKEHFSSTVYRPKETTSIEQPPMTENRAKIKMKISIDKLAYLIRLMQESNLFEYPNKTDVARIIIEHFSTKGTENIGETSMINKLSDTNKDEAVYWAKLLKQWRDKALAV